VILEDAFQGMLTSNVKGLQKLMADLDAMKHEIKEVTEKGDLAALKPLLARMRGKVGNLDKLLLNAEGRCGDLTTDETGNILDLSVRPEQRK